jgi:hypothetical protein
VSAADTVTPIREEIAADIPVFVESDVSVSQVVQALRAAGLSMRLDPYKGIIVSRAQGHHSLN